MSADTAERLLALLPAIFREDPFIGRYLWAFEQVLLDLEHRVDTLDAVFDPARTDPEFLPWLATWTAFTLRADLEIDKQREFLAKVIPLYRRRGTLANLQTLLAIFARGEPTVDEGGDGDPPHTFRVKLNLARDEPREIDRQGAIARALIELEKPAHTHYLLDVSTPSIQVGVFSTVGEDTVLGSRDSEA
jgi:phage tail-like protein